MPGLVSISLGASAVALLAASLFAAFHPREFDLASLMAVCGGLRRPLADLYKVIGRFIRVLVCVRLS